MGWEVATFCISGRGERAAELEAAGLKVFSYERILENGNYRRDPVSITGAVNQLFWLMRRWRPEIAHFYLPAPYLLGAPVAIATGTPIKVMSRRSLSNYQDRWPMAGTWERKLHPKMDVLIGNSRAVVAQLISEDVAESKVRLIHNGIEISSFQADRDKARRELGLDAHALVGVVVANLIHYKGHQDLIRALIQIAHDLPSPWRFLVIGRDEGLKFKLAAAVYRAGLADNIQFLGQRSDIPRLLAAADIGLLTSHEEGFSNVILESMAAGLPIVATAVGGTPDAVLHERTGLLVPPRDAAAIGDAILRLARNPTLRRTLGDAGRCRVEQKFTMESCASAHHELYQGLVAKRVHGGKWAPSM